jgi:hypothetical protein
MNGISANVTSNEQDLYFNTIHQILRKSGTVYMLQAKCVYSAFSRCHVIEGSTLNIKTTEVFPIGLPYLKSLLDYPEEGGGILLRNVITFLLVCTVTSQKTTAFVAASNAAAKKSRKQFSNASKTASCKLSAFRNSCSTAI